MTISRRLHITESSKLQLYYISTCSQHSRRQNHPRVPPTARQPPVDINSCIINFNNQNRVKIVKTSLCVLPLVYPGLCYRPINLQQPPKAANGSSTESLTAPSTTTTDWRQTTTLRGMKIDMALHLQRGYATTPSL